MWKVDQGSQSGITTASYSTALSWQTAELSAKTILLKNTHASLSLKYRLSGCVNGGGITKELVAETTLETGEIAEFHYHRQWDNLTLAVKNGSGVSAYQIDYEGQGA